MLAGDLGFQFHTEVTKPGLDTKPEDALSYGMVEEEQHFLVESKDLQPMKKVLPLLDRRAHMFLPEPSGCSGTCAMICSWITAGEWWTGFIRDRCDDDLSIVLLPLEKVCGMGQRYHLDLWPC